MPGIGASLGDNAATPPSGAPPVAPLAASIAQSTQAANAVNPASKGGPGTWAKNIVAGVQNALSGFSVPGGSGPLQGIGDAAKQGQAQRQQKFENDQKTQAANRAQTNEDRNYRLRDAENARQQATSIQSMAEHNQRMQAFTQESSIRNFNLMKSEAEFRSGQADQLDALHAAGAKPLQVGDKPAPEFDNLADAAKYATANDLAKAHSNDYRTRPVFDQTDNKYKLMELPDTGPKWVTVTGPDGKPTKINATPTEVMAYAEKMSAIRHQTAESNELDQKAALEKLQAGGGTDTDKAIVASAAFQKMQADPDYKGLPKTDDGSINEQSPEYKALDTKYGVSKAYSEANIGYNTATGEAFIRNLSPNMQGTVRGLGEGREDSALLPRGKEKTPIVNALNRAYPGFDEGEQKNFFKQRQNFTSGPQGQAINNGMTAFNHLAELQALNTSESRVVGTPAYTAYHTQLTTVSNELAGFYGTTTIPGIDALNASLGTWASRGTAIQTQAGLMKQKINEYQKQWDDSIPKYLTAAHNGKNPQMPGVDPVAIANRDRLVSGTPATPTYPKSVTVGGQGVPVGANGIFTVGGHNYKVNPDGKGGTLVP
jgi:hypothetical protein